MAKPPAARRRTSHARRAAATDRIIAAAEEMSAALADAGTAIDGAEQDDMLALYGLLADVVNAAKDGQAVIGAALLAVVPSRFDAYQVPGGGVFKFAGGKERKRYDQPALISAAAAAIQEHEGIEGVVTTSGEVLQADPIIERIVSTFAGLAGATAPSFSTWRSGVAKGLGIPLNNYADLEDSPITHRIEGRDRAGAAHG